VSAQTIMGSGLQVMRAIAAMKLGYLGGLFRVTVEPIRQAGTEDQRKRIRAIVGEMAEQTGNDAGVLYEHLLERRFGLEEVDLGNGRVKYRPARRVSGMSWQERSDYIDWLQALAIEFDVVLRR
jgi:hypothetical protein